MEQQKLSMLQFRVKAFLEHGEELRVVGDAPSLGSADSARAVNLETTPTEYPIWYNPKPIYVHTGAIINIQYFVVAGDKVVRSNPSCVRQYYISGPSALIEDDLVPLYSQTAMAAAQTPAATPAFSVALGTTVPTHTIPAPSYTTQAMPAAYFSSAPSMAPVGGLRQPVHYYTGDPSALRIAASGPMYTPYYTQVSGSFPTSMPGLMSSHGVAPLVASVAMQAPPAQAAVSAPMQVSYSAPFLGGAPQASLAYRPVQGPAGLTWELVSVPEQPAVPVSQPLSPADAPGPTYPRSGTAALAPASAPLGLPASYAQYATPPVQSFLPASMASSAASVFTGAGAGSPLPSGGLLAPAGAPALGANVPGAAPQGYAQPGSPLKPQGSGNQLHALAAMQAAAPAAGAVQTSPGKGTQGLVQGHMVGQPVAAPQMGPAAPPQPPAVPEAVPPVVAPQLRSSGSFTEPPRPEPPSPAGSVDHLLERTVSGPLATGAAQSNASQSFRPRASTAPSIQASSALLEPATSLAPPPAAAPAPQPLPQVYPNYQNMAAPSFFNGLTVHWVQVQGSAEPQPVLFLPGLQGAPAPAGPLPSVQVLGTSSIPFSSTSASQPQLAGLAVEPPHLATVPEAPVGALPTTTVATAAPAAPTTTDTAAAGSDGVTKADTDAVAAATPSPPPGAASLASIGVPLSASETLSASSSPSSFVQHPPRGQAAEPTPSPPTYGSPHYTGDAGAAAVHSRNITSRDRIVIAMYYLPVTISLDADDRFVVDWDEEALLSAKRPNGRGLDHDDFPNVYWVGTPRLPAQLAGRSLTLPEQKALQQELDQFNCTPVFLSPELAYHFYEGFCKDTLWPALHNVVDVYGRYPTRWWNKEKQERRWSAYQSVNRKFCTAITQRWSESCIIWIQDYHLLLMPQTLARRFSKTFIGLYLHTPFPSSEVFRTLSFREGLLHSMLCVKHIGFHLYEYARHFVTACQRILGTSVVPVESKEDGLYIRRLGYLVKIRVSHPGIEVDWIRRRLAQPSVRRAIADYKAGINGMKVIGAVDRAERLQGLPMKLRAFHQLLVKHPELQGKVVMRQVVVKPPDVPFIPKDEAADTVATVEPFRSPQALSRDLTEPEAEAGGTVEGVLVSDASAAAPVAPTAPDAENESLYSSNKSTSCVPNTAEASLVISEVRSLAQRTNQLFGEGTVEVKVVSAEETGIVDRLALWKSTDVFCNTTIRDSTNYTALEYVTARGKPAGVLVLSEFLSLSRALTGAYRVNPMNQGDLVEAMYEALMLNDAMKAARRAEMVQWVRTHTTTEWAKHTLADVKAHLESQRDEKEKVQPMGFGFSYRLTHFRVGFKELDFDQLKFDYRSAFRRIYFIDLGGTLTRDRVIMVPSSTDKQGRGIIWRPRRRIGIPQDVKRALAVLSDDPSNAVFIVSGKGRTLMSGLFKDMPNLGLIAENGSFIRWPATLRYVAQPSRQAPALRKEGDALNSRQRPRRQQAIDSENWECTCPHFDNSWWPTARTILTIYTSRTNGSFVALKEKSLVWNFKNSDPEFGSMQAKELAEHIEGIMRNCNIDVVRGDHYVELRPAGVNKGNAAVHVMDRLEGVRQASIFGENRSKLDGARVDNNAIRDDRRRKIQTLTPFDFIFAIGDDASDDLMFTALRERRNDFAEQAFSQQQQVTPKSYSPLSAYASQPSLLNRNRHSTTYQRSLREAQGSHRRTLTGGGDARSDLNAMESVAEEREESGSPSPDAAAASVYPPQLSMDRQVLYNTGNRSQYVPPDMMIMQGGAGGGIGFSSVQGVYSQSAVPPQVPGARRATLYTITVGENPNEADFFVDSVSTVHEAMISLAKGITNRGLGNGMLLAGHSRNMSELNLRASQKAIGRVPSEPRADVPDAPGMLSSKSYNVLASASAGSRLENLKESEDSHVPEQQQAVRRASTDGDIAGMSEDPGLNLSASPENASDLPEDSTGSARTTPSRTFAEPTGRPIMGGAQGQAQTLRGFGSLAQFRSSRAATGSGDAEAKAEATDNAASGLTGRSGLVKQFSSPEFLRWHTEHGEKQPKFEEYMQFEDNPIDFQPSAAAQQAATSRPAFACMD